MTQLKNTALHSEHIRLKAKMVDFSGWKMPLQYNSTVKEHETVRKTAGLFDVSHMGEIGIEGKDAIAFTDYLVANSVDTLKNGQICYSPMCNEEGGVIDDVLVYRLSNSSVMVVINAGNADKDFRWITEHQEGFSVEIRNRSNEYSLMALQGPMAEELLQRISQIKLSAIPFYCFTHGRINGIKCLVSRTGYTGEDGFEIYVGNEASIPLWRKILEVGTPVGATAAGLGARDSLRFEACYMLYGNELTEEITPVEAGLKWTLSLDKEFIGKRAIVERLENGTEKVLRAIEIKGKSIARHGMEVLNGKKKIGWISSGMFSPSLGKPLALAYIDRGHSKVGTQVSIKIRDRIAEGKVVKKPFYKGSVKSKK